MTKLELDHEGEVFHWGSDFFPVSGGWGWEKLGGERLNYWFSRWATVEDFVLPMLDVVDL